MPKLSKIQSSFNSGEVSQNLRGRIDSDRYDSSLQICQNYIPILQGPLLRRPGTKYVSNVKDSTKPPSLIPFNFSGGQAYILEFGEKYIRFFANDGQVITSSNQFQVNGTYGQTGRLNMWNFTGTRADYNSGPGEVIVASGVIAPQGFTLVPAGSILELVSPYTQADVSQLRFVQNQDTLFITHPAYPPHKLQRMGATYFDLKPLFFKDGPYLPLNSYATIGDSPAITLTPSNTGFLQVSTGTKLIGAAVDNGAGLIRIGVLNHGFNSGDQVFIAGVTGTTEANNGTSSISASFWKIINIDANNFDLFNSKFTHPMVGSTGTVSPALFKMQTAPSTWQDMYYGGGRNIGLYNNAVRYWGTIVNVLNPATAVVEMGQGQNLPNTSVISIWQLGSFYGSNFPVTCCFHQNRLLFAGQPRYPQEIDGSYSGDYENFAASGSNIQVTDANAYQFSLLANETTPIYWLKSAAQGLLAGTISSEWQMAPNNQSGALTPTNFSAQKLASFGAANTDAAQIGNAVIYMQSAQRRMREMSYFFQAGTFRSTNLSELSEHITYPNVIQLAVQKEPNPLIWGLRSDGQLISLSYNRDDVSLKAGYARHILGGQSDAAGTPPMVKSIAVAAASSALYQELWMTVSRTINNSSVVTVEYMTKTLPEIGLQEDAYYLDCGITFDNPLAVTAITNAASCVVTSPAHGIANSSTIRFNTVFGVNTSVIDANGNTSISNLLNGNTFMVASSSTNSFKIQDFTGKDINTQSYTAYLGSAVVRKLITNISGLDYLQGETVGILADGGIHPDVVVSGSGAIHLSYPAGKVQIGYRYNSDAMTLRTHEGSAQGTSIGSTRRVNRVAFLFHNVAELSVGPSFTNLIPVEFERANSNADAATPMVSGIIREGFQGTYTYDDTVCWRQSGALPGTINAVIRFLEEQDV